MKETIGLRMIPGWAIADEEALRGNEEKIRLWSLQAVKIREFSVNGLNEITGKKSNLALLKYQT